MADNAAGHMPAAESRKECAVGWIAGRAALAAKVAARLPGGHNCGVEPALQTDEGGQADGTHRLPCRAPTRLGRSCR